jgi:hypothetical protein
MDIVTSQPCAERHDSIAAHNVLWTENSNHLAHDSGHEYGEDNLVSTGRRGSREKAAEDSQQPGLLYRSRKNLI